jgi:maleylacetate reductase
VFGWGRVAELAAEIDRAGATRAMLISQRSTTDVAARVGRELGDRVVARLGNAPPHAPRDEVSRARRIALDSGADCVIAIGGGSATGIAKATVLEVRTRLIAVPTTYAGSEVTAIYGITADGRKTTGRDAGVVPSVVVYDPELTVSLPPPATGASGLNAIAHCVEALYWEAPSPLVRLLACEGVRMLAGALPSCSSAPRDRDARSSALYGAYLAGTVLALAGMALHHRICHVLGGAYGLSHSMVNASVLPHVVAFNAPAAVAAVDDVARSLGREDVPAALFDLAGSLGVPMALRELGLASAALRNAAEMVVESDFYNPRPVTRRDVESILIDAFDGARPA